jgi:uncharacterized membrane protein
MTAEATDPVAPGPPLARMVIAVLALVGLLVSSYLTLYKVGLLGIIQCGADGGCSVVQASEYAEFLGLPVALYGVGAYALLLGLALLGVQPGRAELRWIAVALVVLSGIGVGVSALLTYISSAVIGAYCRWCLVSAALITLIFLVSLAGLRAPGRRTEASA